MSIGLVGARDFLQLKTVFLTVLVDFVEKHIVRAAPKLVVAIKGAICNHFFAGFTMVNDIFDKIEIALIVSINAGDLKLSGHMLL